MAQEKDSTIESARKFAAAGQFAQAIKAWRQLLDDSPNDANIYNTIGDLYLKNKANTEATDAYSKAAQFFLKEGFYLKAIAVYKKILKIEPDRGDIYTLLGDLNAGRGLLINAIADYLTGAKLYLKAGKTKYALNLYRKITKINPANINARLRAAELSLKEHEKNAAIDEYLFVAEEYERLEKNDDARELYEKIIGLSPSHPVARRRLGMAPLPGTEDLEVSREALASAIRMTVSDAQQASSVEIGGAIEFNPEGLELEPFVAPAPAGSVSPVEPIETTVIEVRIPEEAAVEVGAFPPIDAELETTLQEFRAGISEQVGEEDFESHYNLGIAYKEMGLLDEGIAEFQRAARGPMRFLDSCSMIAACYRDRKRNKSAIAFLESVLADSRCNGPGASYMTYELALLYEDEGFADKAAQLYASVPTIRDAAERLTRLREGGPAGRAAGQAASAEMSQTL